MKVAILIISLLLAACGSDDKNSPPSQERKFLFGMVNDNTGALDFAAATSNPAVISTVLADLDRPKAQRRHINGAIDRGGSGNMNWDWHFKPDEWVLEEASMELCDGSPMDPQANPGYWVDTVGRFCPWGSFVKQEIQQ